MKAHLKEITVGSRSVTPSKIVCIGRNYHAHIRELGNQPPGEMVIFVKPNSAIGSQLSACHQEQLHYEGELSFLVENNRLSAVGFGLDLTKRALQGDLKAQGLPWERAKAFDGSALFSRFVEIAAIPDGLAFELAINGKRVQLGNLELMIHKPQEILREVSSFMTWQDGDILMTGTPAGVGPIDKGDVFSAVILDRDKPIIEASWVAH